MAPGGEIRERSFNPRAMSGFLVPTSIRGVFLPCPWSDGEPQASSSLSSSATGWFSLPGPLSLPSVPWSSAPPACDLPVTVSQGLVPGAALRFWAVGWAWPQNQGSFCLPLEFCKADPFTRIVLTPGALYYWSSCLGLLFYINKEMSKNWRQ